MWLLLNSEKFVFLSKLVLSVRCLKGIFFTLVCGCCKAQKEEHILYLTSFIRC